MRPIAPLALPGVLPADLTGMRQPDFDLVNPRELYIEDQYQRSIGPRSREIIGRIYSGFRWSKFKPPICVKVDGKLCVVDGQHSAIAAASHPDITVIPVVIVDEPEARDRAAAFVSHARDRLAATPAQVHRAEVSAGDPEAAAVQAVCDRARVILRQFPPSGGQPYGPGETIALAAIKALIKRRGDAAAERVLNALFRAECAPITSELIKAAEALLCEPEYAAEFDVERLAMSLKAVGSKAHTEARELAAAKGLPMWRALTAVVFKHRKGRSPAPAMSAMRTSQLPMRRVIDRTPPVGPVPMGEPGPGRSALDQRRAQA